MPDEHMCKCCKKFDTCSERKELEREGDIVVDCKVFEEVDDSQVPQFAHSLKASCRAIIETLNRSC